MSKRSRPSVAQEIASTRRAIEFYEGVLKLVGATGVEDPVGVLARATHHQLGMEIVARAVMLSGMDIKEVSKSVFECTIPVDTPIGYLLDLVNRAGMRPATWIEVMVYAAKRDEKAVLFSLGLSNDGYHDTYFGIAFDRDGRNSLGGEYTIKYKPLPGRSTFLAFSGYESNVLVDHSKSDRRCLSNTGFYRTLIKDMSLRDANSIITGQGRRIGSADEFERLVKAKGIDDLTKVSSTPLVLRDPHLPSSAHVLSSFYSELGEPISFIDVGTKLPMFTWIYTCEAEQES